jgi:hypothetical protein
MSAPFLVSPAAAHQLHRQENDADEEQNPGNLGGYRCDAYQTEDTRH